MSPPQVTGHAVPQRGCRRCRAQPIILAALISALFHEAGRAQSLPQGARVVAGTISFRAPSAGSLTVTQRSDVGIINWNSFSVGAGGTVTFVQPSSASWTLNRVTGSTSSTIAGQILANGHVYLINPNGIQITPSGTVNVFGFGASSLGMTDADFLAGRLQFQAMANAPPPGAVSNDGVIQTPTGGSVLLIGGSVTNTGSITAPQGRVGLAAAGQVSVDLQGDNFLSVSVPPTGAALLQALIAQPGKIRAKGGQVVLRAASSMEVARAAINVSGDIEADAVIPVDGGLRFGRAGVDAAGRAGSVTLDAGPDGDVSINGRLQAAGSVGRGGDLVVTGRNITLDGAQLDVSGGSGGGAIRLGGDWHGSGALPHAQTVVVDAASVLDADATRAGRGGSVVLWSDEQTEFSGQISARGNGPAGSGGDVEVSSHGLLAFAGHVDLLAPHGDAGQLLLDPYNVTIRTSAGAPADTCAAGTCTPSGTNSILTVAALQSALANGNVTVTTGASGADAGTITVSNAVTWASSSGLTLSAQSNINVNASITATGSGSLALNSAAGSVALSGATVSTHAGSLTASGTVSGNATGLTLSNAVVSVGSGGGTLSGTSASGFGATVSGTTNLSATAGGSLTVNGTLNTSTGVSFASGLDFASGTALTTAGTVTLNGNGTNAGHGVVFLGSATAASTGSLSVQGTAAGVRNGLLFNGGATITANSGGIAFSGTTSGSGVGVTENAGTLTLTNGGSGTFSLTGNNTSGNGLNIAGAGLATSGAVTLAGVSSGGVGINFPAGASLSESSGVLQLSGTSTSSQGVLFTGVDVVNAGTGAVTINGASSTNNALQMAVGASLSTAGNVALSGTSNSLAGVYLLGTDTITASAGTLSIQGYSTSSYGAWFNAGTNTLANSGAGSFSLSGISGSNYGMGFNGSNSTNLTTSGALSLSGSSTSGNGLSLLGSNTLTVSGGALALSGNVSGATGLDGVALANATVNSTGNLTINGSTASTGTVHRGLNLVGTDSITATSGTIALAGTDTTGGAGLSIANLSLVNTGGGSFALTGIGGTVMGGALTTSGAISVTGDASATSGNGVVFSSGASVASGGSLTVTGTSGAFASNRFGVEFLGANSLTASAGDFVVTGTGTSAAPGIYLAAGALTLSNNGGGAFSLSGSSVTSAGFQVQATGAVTTTGGVSLAGTSTGYVGFYAAGSSSLTDLGGGLAVAGTSNTDAGVQFRASDSIVNSGSGALSITASSTSYRGLDLFNGSSLTLAGTISINASSTSGNGISFSGTNTLVVSSGSVALAGTSGSSAGVAFVHSVGDTISGAVSISGSSSSGAGLAMDSGLGLNLVGNVALSGRSTSASGFVLAGADVLTISSGGVTLRGSTASANMLGFDLSSSGNTITNSGSGVLTLNGTGGDSIAAAIASPNAPLVITDTGAVTEVAGTLTAGSLLLGGAGTFMLGGANSVGTLAANVGSLNFKNAGDLVLGTVQGTAGIASARELTISAGANLSIAPGVQVTGMNPVLSTTQAFINGAGAGAVYATVGNWDIYSASPGVDTFGNLDSGRAAIWNATYTSAPPGSLAASGDRYVFSYQPTIAVASTNITKMYGVDATAATAAAYSTTGFQPGVANAFLGDTAATVLSGAPSVISLGSASTASVSGSAYTIDVAAGTLTASSGYALTYQNSGALSVTPRPVTVSANGQTQVYGNATPTLTYAVGGAGLVNGDVFTGALTTGASSTAGVGSYAITQGTLAASSNYALSYVPANAAVTPRPIVLAADNQAQVYGNATPTLTYAIGGAGLVNGDVLSGVLATSASSTAGVGAYAITQGTLAASSNYAVSYAAANDTVAPRPITVSANGQTQMYGSATPTLTFTIGGMGLVNGDTLVGALASTATGNVNVGSYSISQGNLAASNNYALTFTAASDTVTPRPITVSASGQTQVYGNPTPTLTYAVGGAGLVNEDTLTGTLTTSASSTAGIGSYAITPGTLAASSNYAVSYTAASDVVTPRPITVAANGQTQVYGNTTPTLTYAIGGAGLVNGDTLTGTLTTSASSTAGIGSYAITSGNLAASSNYAVSYTAASDVVTPRPITVAANGQTQLYGNATPTLTYAVGGAGLVNGDTLTGTLTTGASSTAGIGSYAITSGTLAASSNYAVSYTAASDVVTPRPITVAANSQTQVYGDTTPTLTYAVGGAGLVNGDTLTGTLTTGASSTAGIGSYAITSGTLAASSNYAVSYTTASDVVTPRPITVSANGQTQVYGNATPTLTYTVGGAGLVNGAAFTGALATGASSTAGVGSYAITPGTLAASSNYAVSYTAASDVVTPRPITVAANGQTQVYGNTTPTLTYAVGGAGLVNGDTLTGTLTTGASSTGGIGSYAITSGTLAASSNYTISYTAASDVVTPRPITVAANVQTQLYGNATPTLTYAVGGAGLVNGDTLTGTLTTSASSTAGIGSYAITPGTLAASSNYAVSYTAASDVVTPRPITVSANGQTQVYGNTTPTLTYAVGGAGLVNGDTLTGTLTTGASSTAGIGSYAITSGTLAASSNYAVSYTTASDVVTPRPITVSANGQTQVYGNATPTLTYTVGGAGLVNGAAFTGALATGASSTAGVGSYAITPGTLAASSNYAVSYTAASDVVTPRPITVAANGQTQVYGNTTPTLTYAVGGAGLVNGDTLTGTLTTGASSTGGIGSYAITSGTLAASSNYTISYTAASDVVTPRPITVAANVQTQLYGNATPTLTYAVGGAGLVNGDTLTGTLTTSASSTAGIGSYAITPGTLAASSNYAVSYTAASDVVTPRPITVSANGQTQVYGHTTPTLTYTVGGMGLVNGDTLNGALTTLATTASDVGSYAIVRGTLAASANYALSFSGAELLVTPVYPVGAWATLLDSRASLKLPAALASSCLYDGADEHSGSVTTADMKMHCADQR